MTTQKMKPGKEQGLTLNKCIELMRRQGIAQYRRAGKCIFEYGSYARTRSQGRPLDGGHKCAWDVYILTDEGYVTTLFYNTKFHRAKVALKAYLEGKLEQVDAQVWNNYITNGYTTRRGLFANYTDGKVKRMDQLARSHADYMGSETGSSKLDHEHRVMMRN